MLLWKTSEILLQQREELATAVSCRLREMSNRLPRMDAIEEVLFFLLLLRFSAWAERLPDGGDGGASRLCGRNVVDGNWRHRGTGAVL